MRCCFAAICRFICCPFCSCCWVCYSLSLLLEWLLMLLYAAWCVVLLEAVWSAQSLEVGCWFLWLLCTISWFVASSLAGWFPAAGCCCFLLYCRLAFLTDDCFSEEEPCCCLLACVQLWPVLQSCFHYGCTLFDLWPSRCCGPWCVLCSLILGHSACPLLMVGAAGCLYV